MTSDLIKNIVIDTIKTRNRDRRALAFFKKAYSHKAFYDEIASIRINLGRRVGHTTAAKALIKHYCSQAKHVVLVVPYKTMLDQYKDVNSKYLTKIVCGKQPTKLLRGVRDDIVIIDSATYSKKTRDYIATTTNAEWIIELG